MKRATLPWRQPPLTEEQENELFMLLLEDDTEDAPWMVMGDLQFWSAASFAQSLRSYARQNRLPWYVASMLPIQFTYPGTEVTRVLAPDTFVAFVADQVRSSYDVDVEGKFPAFVLEVLSPSSVERDQIEKRDAYELLGAEEYALFTPRVDAPSSLEGFYRGKSGVFEPRARDAEGRWTSDVLGLQLVALGSLLRARTLDGYLLPTLEEAEEDRAREAEARRAAESARAREAEARRAAESARTREAEARRAAEAEVERLRREIERLRNPER